jgi:hypothetical protein
VEDQPYLFKLAQRKFSLELLQAGGVKSSATLDSD